MASTRVNTRNAAYRDIDALIDSERRFRLLVEGVIDYAIYMLDPDGIVTNWNAGAQRIKGYAADEIVGQHFQHLLHPGGPSGRPARPSARDRRREGKFEAEGWRVRKDGTRFCASVVIDPIYERRRAGRLRQDHPRHHRAADGARVRCTDSERNFRLLVSGVTDYALYMLDPERHRVAAGTPAASGSKATRRRNHRPAFLALLHRRGSGRRRARRGRCRLRARPAATKRKAGASARTDRSSGPASSSIRSATKTAS